MREYGVTPEYVIDNWSWRKVNALVSAAALRGKLEKAAMEKGRDGQSVDVGGSSRGVTADGKEMRTQMPPGNKVHMPKGHTHKDHQAQGWLKGVTSASKLQGVMGKDRVSAEEFMGVVDMAHKSGKGRGGKKK